MIMRKSMFVLATSLCLLTYPAAAQERTPPGVQAETETFYGVVNSVDPAKNRLVISDTVYGYSPLSVVVRKRERTSGVSSLRPNQEVRFICSPRKLGTPLSATRTITELWIEKD